MNIVPSQNVWFDDAATLAMGEAFDQACKSLRNLGSAVPSRTGLLQPPRMASAIPPASMSKH
jgi:hypothetical protein